jgi:hypothetical protein
MDMVQQRKKTTGRKKIEIKKLDKESNKQVTFSKRRQGLFKKASELCILCDVRAAIIVFSPADKLYSFGQPNTDVILTSYINGTTEFEDAKSTEDSSIYAEYNEQYEKACWRWKRRNWLMLKIWLRLGIEVIGGMIQSMI